VQHDDVHLFEGSVVSRIASQLGIVFIALTILIAGPVAGATTPNAKSILAKALADASTRTNVTLLGTIEDSGLTATIDGGFSTVGNGGVTTVDGVGTQYQFTRVDAKQCFVKATTLAVLKEDLGVKNPTASEIGVWYVLKKGDSRYQNVCSPGGAQTVAQSFSFSPIGWSKNATYKGMVTIHGVRTFKLLASSNLFVDGRGFQKTTLYVTDTAKPLPFATSGPIGSTGLLYLTKWGSTSVTIPASSLSLPL